MSLRRPGLCSPRLNTPLPLIPFLLLCYLAHVMTKTVSSMHLSSESKQQIRHDLGEVVRFKKLRFACICASLSLSFSLSSFLPQGLFLPIRVERRESNKKGEGA